MLPITVLALVPNPVLGPTLPNWVLGVYLVDAERHPDNSKRWCYYFTTDPDGRIAVVCSKEYRTKHEALSEGVRYVETTYHATEARTIAERDCGHDLIQNLAKLPLGVIPCRYR